MTAVGELDERAWLRLVRGAEAVPMTCRADRCEHAITEGRFLHGRGRGQFEAVCGRQVVPGSLFAAPGRVCSGCAVELLSGESARARRAGLARDGRGAGRGRAALRRTARLLRPGQHRLAGADRHRPGYRWA
ncbi:MAG: hypothetical protein M3Z25_15470 [Actinomycetota bacterium]|nr:hypothetical protein [Actinomycetota bacterium]